MVPPSFPVSGSLRNLKNQSTLVRSKGTKEERVHLSAPPNVHTLDATSQLVAQQVNELLALTDTVKYKSP